MWSPGKKKFGGLALNTQLQGACLRRQQKGCFVISTLRENLQQVLERYLGIGS